MIHAGLTDGITEISKEIFLHFIAPEVIEPEIEETEVIETEVIESELLEPEIIEPEDTLPDFIKSLINPPRFDPALKSVYNIEISQKENDDLGWVKIRLGQIKYE